MHTIFYVDCLELKRRTLKNGTTTACYFATIHTDASLLLGELAGTTHAIKETHTDIISPVTG